ncbi:MAG: radical SAM protein, partial [Planctomycetes bacterium]|nr:radical SAM protein [Planctomycetota bacterium]
MVRRVDNPPNPFSGAECHWLGEAPAVACGYCFARPTHEYLELGAGTDFDSHIIAKINAPELLDAALSRRSWRGEPIYFSGVTDCYQPYESVYRLTRRCLEVCVRHRNPIGMVTKGYLVARDADVLTQLSRLARVRVYLSIPFASDNLARRVETGAPPPSRRFDALRLLAEAGVSVGVLVAPVIPGLSDREIPQILQTAAKNGATSAAFMALRLPGSVADVFLSRLRTALPDHAARVVDPVRSIHGGKLNDPRFGCRMSGEGPYWESIRQLFYKTASRLGLSDG